MVAQLTSNVTKFQTKCGLAIEQHLNEHSKGSEFTKNSYQGDITKFLRVVFKGRTIDTITSEELDTLDYDKFADYIKYMQSEKLSNNTMNRHIASIKGMYETLKGREIIKSDISFLKLIKTFNNDGEEIEAMPLEVFYEYLEEIKKEKHHAEAKELLLKLAVDQGIRLGAMLNLTWKSFVQREDGVVIKGLDKGNKKFIKVMSHKMYEELLTLKKADNTTEFVFEPLKAKSVSNMMIRIRKKLGYEDEGYSFHSLRKTAITFEHRMNGGDIVETQRFSGHSNMNMLQIYVDSVERSVKGVLSTENQDKEAYKKASHEELLEVIDELGLDIKQLINAKIQQKHSKL